MSDLSRNVGDMEFDGLVVDTTPAVQTGGAKIKKLGTAATLKRGTLLYKGVDGKFQIYNGPENTGTQKFSGDGTATTFTVTAKPAKITGVKVGTSDAVVSDYNPHTGVVTLSAAPAAGTNNVVVSYVTGEGNVPSAILCDDTDVGTASDVDTVVYTAGCFDPAAVTVKEGYTISADDVDALRKYGIVFKSAQ